MDHDSSLLLSALSVDAVFTDALGRCPRARYRQRETRETEGPRRKQARLPPQSAGTADEDTRCRPYEKVTNPAVDAFVATHQGAKPDSSISPAKHNVPTGQQEP